MDLTTDSHREVEVFSVLSHKPVDKLKKIMNLLAPYSESFTAPKGNVFYYNKNISRQCFFLFKGSVALHRRGDGMILNSESAPFILGVSNQFAQADHLYVRVREDARMGSLPLELFNQLIEKYDLWECLATILIYTTSRVYEHCTQIAQMSTYEIIRFQLQELMQEPPSIRLNITAANYIKGRSYLSRSGIMRILSELKKAEYITTERGVLLKIRRLPEKY
ncbi:MAG: helix-turn-helix domain-containing protein [Enterobacterales bacterium]|uniref:winged helix-turn-helix transcriptional regulator n=1 Tax=Serratia sp. (in: enterobacteria) TaxID=616 RepID=UPI003F3EB0C6